MGVMSEHKINQLVIHDLQNAKIMSCSSGDTLYDINKNL